VLPQRADVGYTETGVRVEELGYDGLWLPELWGTSSVVRLTDIAAHTDEIGLGTSTEKAVEDLHGVDWNDPDSVGRARETIELTREFLGDADRVDYTGDVFDVRDFPALDADVPVYQAALGVAGPPAEARSQLRSVAAIDCVTLTDPA